MKNFIVSMVLLAASPLLADQSPSVKESINYNRVELAEKNIVGIELRTSNQAGRAMQEIPQHWQRFYREKILEKIPNKANSKIYVLYTDYEGDHTKPYSCIIGCEVSSLEGIPTGLVAKAIPSTAYAQLMAKGPFPQSLIKTWQAIWSSNLSRTYTGDFEVYEADFNPYTKSDVNVFIAIK